MQEILDTAARLADAIAKSDRFIALRSAEKAVAQDAEAKSLAETFQEKTLAIAQKEHDLKPVEVSEKREVAVLKEKIAAHPLLQKLNKAQADYHEMMNKVNRILFERLEAGA